MTNVTPIESKQPAPDAAPSKAVPVCPVHRASMKASRKPGSFFCPKRLDDGDYCPEKA